MEFKGERVARQTGRGDLVLAFCTLVSRQTEGLIVLGCLAAFQLSAGAARPALEGVDVRLLVHGVRDRLANVRVVEGL